jgi:2-keto-3-deoxy-L-rhamnonate aldolase RhmA
LFATHLKQRVRNRELTVGVLLTFDFWSGYLEIFKAEGIDYAVLDLEHGACNLRTAEELCRTARLLDFPLLVRPEASVHHMVKKYMDIGAAGLMMPWAETQQQIDAMRDAVFTPPRGRRGPGGPSTFANRSLDRAGWDEVESSFFLMFQVESQAGMVNVRTFAQADWIDATMLGPYDLSLNLSRWGQVDHPDVVEAIRQVRLDSESAGKPCGMVPGTPEQARFWINEGFRLLLLPDPVFLARQRVQSFLAAIRAFS